MVGWSMEREKIDLYRRTSYFIIKCKEWSKLLMVKCINEWIIDQEIKLKRRHADTWRDHEKWIIAVGFWSVDFCRWD